MSEASNMVSGAAQPVPHTARRADAATITWRTLTIVCALAGSVTTLNGLPEVWAGEPATSRFGRLPQQLWALTPYVALVAISLFRLSKRSLATLLVTTLLAWFMSTGYRDLDGMGLIAMAIPLIQLAFVAGALGIMFTFWLLRKRKG